MAAGRDDRADLDDRALAAAGVGAAAQAKQHRAAGVRHLAHVVETDRLAVVDPLERHAGDVGAQHLLRQSRRAPDRRRCRMRWNGRLRVPLPRFHAC
jgi:hypothetical protein